MHITRRPHPPGLKVYAATCPTCRCDFEFVAGEAERVTRDGRELLQLLCPCCGFEVTTEFQHAAKAA